MEPLLSTQNLQIRIKKEQKILVNDLSYTIYPGDVLGIVGESGSGKSLSCLSLLGLLPNALETSNGVINYIQKDQSSVNLMHLREKDWRRVRANEISMIFQEPLTALNPVLKCKNQLEECLEMAKVPKNEWKKRSKELLDEVNLLDTERILYSYPFELSGGQRQRVMIAMALASNPRLLIADEPTTALDVLVTIEIIELLKNLCKERGMAMIFVSHDLELVKGLANDLLVMFQGQMMDYGKTNDVINHPKSAYTKALMACVPKAESKYFTLPTISEMVKDSTEGLEYQEFEQKPSPRVKVSEEEVIQITDIRKRYPNKRKAGEYFIALNGVNLTVLKGECLGIVGASGSGKSTLAKSLVNLEKIDSGSVVLMDEGRRIPVASKNIQMVFQDPFSSLNPFLRVGELLVEPLLANKLQPNHKEAEKVAIESLESVGLKPEDMDKYPHEFSGGQRQRINVARALCLKPKILVLDESVSALDVSVQAQVLNLLKEIQVKYEITFVFITHDLQVAAYFCERIAVMNQGEVVEVNESLELFHHPKTEYSKRLLDAK